MIIQLLSGGILGAFIGYFTNFIALRMLFYPKKNIMGIQGLLPKYKENFAEKAIDFVFQFIDFDEILTETVNRKAFTKGVRKMGWGWLKRSVAHMIAREIEHYLENKYLRKYIVKEIDKLTPQAKVMLARRIVNSNIDNLTNMILKSTSKEMKFIQFLGGIFGFIIGILEPLILYKSSFFLYI